MRFQSSMRDCMTHIYILQQIDIETEKIDKKWSDEHNGKLAMLLKLYQSKGGNFGTTQGQEEYEEEEYEE